jgi:hypothetical protein
LEPIRAYDLINGYFTPEIKTNSFVIDRAKNVQDEIEDLRKQLIAVQRELEKMKKPFRCESLL